MVTKVRPGPISILEIFPLVESQKPMTSTGHKDASTVNQEQLKQYNLADVFTESGPSFSKFIIHWLWLLGFHCVPLPKLMCKKCKVLIEFDVIMKMESLDGIGHFTRRGRRAWSSTPALPLCLSLWCPPSFYDAVKSSCPVKSPTLWWWISQIPEVWAKYISFPYKSPITGFCYSYRKLTKPVTYFYSLLMNS